MAKKHKNQSIENISVEKEIHKDNKQQAKQSQENKQKLEKNIHISQSQDISIEKNSVDTSIDVED